MPRDTSHIGLPCTVWREKSPTGFEPLFLDVPRIFMNYISRQKIERATPIFLVAAARGADITLSIFRTGDRAFHLHRHKMSRPPHHNVVTRGVSPRLADPQAMLRRGRHEFQLRPLAALFAVGDLSTPISISH